MNASRYLVRVFPGGINKWIETKTDPEALAKVFDLNDREQSVYEVADGEEEWLAVAAHKLADPYKSLEATSVLRIDRSELSRFGIRVDEDQFGTTGVPRWDRRHRNLVAPRDQLIELVRSLYERCYRGHDLVRRIEKAFIVRALNSICTYPPCHCPDHIKLIAQWCQRNPRDGRPQLSSEQIEGELSDVEFEDEAIRPGAERLSSGNLLRDWHDSLNALRRSYAEQYLPEIVKRFRLPRPDSANDDPTRPAGHGRV